MKASEQIIKEIKYLNDDDVCDYLSSDELSKLVIYDTLHECGNLKIMIFVMNDFSYILIYENIVNKETKITYINNYSELIDKLQIDIAPIEIRFDCKKFSEKLFYSLILIKSQIENVACVDNKYLNDFMKAA